MSWREGWRDTVRENGSYKLVALFAALVLWVAILNRKDTSMVREYDIEYWLKPGTTISNQMVKKAVVRVSGTRLVLKKFSQAEPTILIDLRGVVPGSRKVRLTGDLLNLPFGAKIISITPEVLVIDLKELGPAS